MAPSLSQSAMRVAQKKSTGGARLFAHERRIVAIRVGVYLLVCVGELLQFAPERLRRIAVSVVDPFATACAAKTMLVVDELLIGNA
jgi:hypothetical protein